MRYRNDDRRFSRNTNTALLPYITAFRFGDTPPQLTRRTIKITDRRETQVTEKTTGTSSGLFFSLAPNETTKKWTSEKTVEIEETYD
jgi:hypothetical protein